MRNNEANVIVTSYQVLNRDQALCKLLFRYCVLDEGWCFEKLFANVVWITFYLKGHLIKNADTATSSECMLFEPGHLYIILFYCLCILLCRVCETIESTSSIDIEWYSSTKQCFGIVVIIWFSVRTFFLNLIIILMFWHKHRPFFFFLICCCFRMPGFLGTAKEFNRKYSKVKQANFSVVFVEFHRHLCLMASSFIAYFSHKRC